MTRLDPERLCAFRLANQHLAVRLPPGSLTTAAACPIQNTPPGSAALALHARVEGLTPVQIEQALIVDKTLVQAWSLRAAPHLFSTADAAPFTLGLLPTDEASLRNFVRGATPALDQIGIHATEILEMVATALVQELDGRTLTKDALGLGLAARLAPSLSPSQASAWESPSPYAPKQTLGESVVRFFLPLAALQGRCCHAARGGNQAFLARTDQWLGTPTPPADLALARAELLRRYLHAHGPSTPEHLAEWAGIAPAQASATWNLLAPELIAIEEGGQVAWILAVDHDTWLTPQQAQGVRFLPPHDPYLNLRDRATLLPDPAHQRHLWRTVGNPGALLVDGRLLAAWRPKKKGRRLCLIIEPFAPWPQKRLPEFEAEAATLAPHRGCTSVELEIRAGL